MKLLSIVEITSPTTADYTPRGYHAVMIESTARLLSP